MALGFFINSEKCYGCQTGQVACKCQQNTSPGVNLRVVTEFNENEPRSLATLSMSCNHCENPVCLTSCPVDAYSKLPSGIVLQDHDLCTGCRICIEVCPYNAPQYDPADGKVTKCSYCVERFVRGLAPRCVDACPGGYLVSGTMEHLSSLYEGVQEIPGVTPEASLTKPSIIINPARPHK